MKRYKSSDLTNKRSEVIKEARSNGVIIECRNTNGEVVDELVIINGKSIEPDNSASMLIYDIKKELLL